MHAQTAAGEVRRALGSYREVRDSMSEGLRFYMSLQEAIATLAQQAGDYVLTRRLQRYMRALVFPCPAQPLRGKACLGGRALCEASRALVLSACLRAVRPPRA